MIKKIGEGWGWGRDDRKRIIYQTGQYDNNDRRRKEERGGGREEGGAHGFKGGKAGCFIQTDRDALGGFIKIANEDLMHFY